MAHVYTPGLRVSSCIRHRCRRVLPIQGEVLVQVGDRVGARDVVAQTFMPGDVTPLNMANMLSLPPSDVPECLLKNEGDRIERNEVLARTKGIFGLFKSECKSKVTGTVESISHVTGQVIVRGEPLPVEVLAYLAGEVVDVIPGAGVVIEADVSFIQGIFGIGGETFGPIRMACNDHSQDLTADLITPAMQSAVVVGGARMTGEAVKKAIEVGVSAVVSGGIDDQDLKNILGYDLGVAITGAEDVGVSLVITEGFGDIAMAKRTFQLFASREGDAAAVNGATQIRAGVLRPEVVISLTDDERRQSVDGSLNDGFLATGSAVRIIRDPHFGTIGTVSKLPPEPHNLESESRARILEVTTEAGEQIVVPRANVEIIGG